MMLILDAVGIAIAFWANFKTKKNTNSVYDHDKLLDKISALADVIANQNPDSVYNDKPQTGREFYSRKRAVVSDTADNKRNYYNDFYEAYKALDMKNGENSFPYHGFRFRLAMEIVITMNGLPTEERRWGFKDLEGRTHTFKFDENNNLFYIYSTTTSNKITTFRPLPDQEIEDVVRQFKMRCQGQ